jgi:soluble lytic murein transglycosylase-like protein
MFCSSRIKKLAVNGVSLVIHFAHGGLLVTGILVAVLATGYFTGALTPYLPVRDANAATVANAEEPVRPVALAVSVEQDGGTIQNAVQVKPLRPEMRAVAGYLARKYRVSTMAIEPLVSAAQSAGAELGLDPLLILAVTAVESRFNPFAESTMGAQGLMQVIPKFHQDKLEQHGTDKSGLLDPEINIRIGARVLKESIRRMGSIEAGLQQYNGAPGDSEAPYANKVMAEKARLEQAMRQQVSRRTRQVGA